MQGLYKILFFITISLLIVNCSIKSKESKVNSKNCIDYSTSSEIVAGSCLDKYRIMAEKIFSIGYNYKDAMKGNCDDYNNTNDKIYDSLQIVLADKVVGNTNLSNEIQFIQFRLLGQGFNSCGAMTSKEIQAGVITPFYLIETDSLYINFGLYEGVSKYYEINGTRLLVGVYPKSYINDVKDKDPSLYLDCNGECEFSFTMYFDNIPKCLPIWNYNHPKHPVTRKASPLTGDMEYMNDCLFDPLFYKSKL